MKEHKVKSTCFYLFAMVSILSGLLLPTVTGAQEFPIMDRVADKVIQRYQNASCEELWTKKGQPKSSMEQRVVQLLKSDPRMREAFINKVAAPIANKMFEGGMIP